MRIILSMLLSMFAAIVPVFAADNDDAKIRGMASFILDVETYKGMFYSVYDFCSPKTSKMIAVQSKKQWSDKNKELLAAQEYAEQKYFKVMRARGVEAEARENLDEVKMKTFARAHDHNRLYKDLLPLADKHIACSKRLGVMNSESMSFKKIAPDSYKYWRSNIAP